MIMNLFIYPFIIVYDYTSVTNWIQLYQYHNSHYSDKKTLSVYYKGIP